MNDFEEAGFMSAYLNVGSKVNESNRHRLY